MNCADPAFRLPLPRAKSYANHMPRPTLTAQFEDIFRRLLAGGALAHFERDLSGLFEVITMNLLAGSVGRSGCYFDGVIGMTATSPSARTLQLHGEIWVGRDKSQWTEPFRAKIVDKTSTKQGIWITVWVGKDRAEGHLASALAVKENLPTREVSP